MINPANTPKLTAKAKREAAAALKAMIKNAFSGKPEDCKDFGDLETDECRWPAAVNHDGKPLFCGQPSEVQTHYCNQHNEMATR